MPKEETIEMRKIRKVQGELTDLPEDNPRATLSSRIRTLLLRMTGVPQLVHLYGTLALNKTLTLNSGENDCMDIFSDGSYLYVALNTTPGKVTKIDLSDFTRVSTLTFDVGEDNCQALLSDGSYLYVALGTVPGKIVKIDLSDFTKVSTLSFTILEVSCTALFSDGSYLYAGLNTLPAKIVKVDLSSFTKVSTLTLPAGENYCKALFSDGSYLYAGLNVFNPGKVTKIDLDDFTRVSTLTLDPNWCTSLFSDGTYLYAGSYVSPAEITKIDLSSFTKVSTLTLPAGENNCQALFSDGTYLYVALNTTPGKVTKIDLDDFTRVSTLTFAAGENTCRSLYSDGTYIYTGLGTSPTKITRRYIIPSGATLRERKIDRIREHNTGREITGSEATTGAVKVLSDVIGQSGKRSVLEGGIVRGVQTLAAGKKATVYVYKYNGSTWDLVDSYPVTKDSGLEANIGQAAHNDYMRISVSHDDAPNSKTFPFVFIVKDME